MLNHFLYVDSKKIVSCEKKGMGSALMVTREKGLILKILTFTCKESSVFMVKLRIFLFKKLMKMLSGVIA